ncbi:MAG TPA: alpha/beta fold hydrolase [Candidatus Hydrogenedentes bacterium]|nr:alpha/beta fold hydrolase [Candidatus Hydrogenedentota bacterium]
MISFVLIFCLAAESQDATMRREAHGEQLEQVLTKSPPWEAWRKKAGEFPPDFDALPSMAELPNPLERWENGIGAPVKTPEDWKQRRQELLSLFHRWILGTVPPPPDNLEAKVLSERDESNAVVRTVELRFGLDHKAVLHLEVMIPKGEGPFPVFMTQDNHRQWALAALRRGYIACVYAGADSRDDTDTFLEAFPGCDWSRLTRRAWAASRCIDYLALEPRARLDQIALTGHSRNGKLSLIASALDERIAVVISSSSGVGGCMPSRYCGEPEFGEGIENITRSFPEWFHPRWRFFAGREQKMPVDLHELVALSAPRSCLLSIALNDSVESTWAMEKTYLSVKPVYQLLSAEDRLRILYRPAGHETWPAVIERYVDWCDTQFGRGTYAFPDRLIHPWDWDAWKAVEGHAVDPAAYPVREFGANRPEMASRKAWKQHRSVLAGEVSHMLGKGIPSVLSPMGTYGEEPDHIEQMLSRFVPGFKIEKQDLMFGGYINADVYHPRGIQDKGKKIPAILWLHPLSFPKGYVAAYARGTQAFLTFAKAGYAVFCYDQLGFGRRIEEVEDFYTRYPDSSLLERMVLDARAALDVLVELPYVDREQVYVVGYGLGAMVALHMAPLEDRPAGYALVCPPSPFRLDTDLAETGGLRRWSHWYMLAPRLGCFIGQESRVPYDIDELLGAMAPRPVLVLSPKYDRENPLPMTSQAVTSAKEIYRLYKVESKLIQEIPETYNHFDPTMQKVVVEWLDKIAQKH